MSMTTNIGDALNDSPEALSAFVGLRVVEVGTWLAAPSASALLADMGAEVIKVEQPGGDPLRHFPGSMRGGDAASPGFALLNRNKKSVVIDMASEAGRKDLDTLLASADVLITNLRVGALDRAGLDAECLGKRFPQLVYAILTGFGLCGPERDRPGYDSGVFWARSGLLHQMTSDAAGPTAVVGGYGDLVTSLSLFAGIMVALFERQKTGRGGLVETSLLQTGAWLLSGDVVAHAAFGRASKPRPRGKSGTPLVNSYRSADGRWFFLTGVEATRHFGSVCRAIEQPELQSDPRFASSAAMRENATALINILDSAFASQPLAHWAARFEQEGVCWERVATPAEIMRDPQIVANGLQREIAWPDNPIAAVAAPFRACGHSPVGVSRTPVLGADTATLLPRLPGPVL